MIVAIRDHQRKSVGIREALRSAGWWVVPDGAPADVLLIDHDIDRPGYRDVIHAYEGAGAKIVLYPHGANPNVGWDGFFEPYPVDACLVIGTGHRDVMLAYGYPRPIYPIGWSFCEQRAFRARAIERVLFAPQHPLGSGYLNPKLMEANRRAFAIVRGWGVQVTVRHVGPLEASGLRHEPGVAYEPAGLRLALGSIDMHDLVVARETFLSLAVARGVPAITFHQVATNDPEVPGEPVVEAKHAAKYAEMMRYPWDLADAGATDLAPIEEAADWRARFIGAQLDPAAVARELQALCEREGSRRTAPSSDARPASAPAPA